MSKNHRQAEVQTELGIDPVDVGGNTADSELFDASEVNEDNRIPFGSFVQRLAYPERPGYHRHWFNDSPGRIMRALQAGYKHVTDPDGKNVSRPVGTAIGGGALIGFLMELPGRWWDKDMALLQKEVDRIDGAIRRGNIEGQVGRDGRYIPPQRPIKIEAADHRYKPEPEPG